MGQAPRSNGTAAFLSDAILVLAMLRLQLAPVKAEAANEALPVVRLAVGGNVTPADRGSLHP